MKLSPLNGALIIALLMSTLLSGGWLMKSMDLGQRNRAQHLCTQQALYQFRKGDVWTGHRFVQGSERAYITGKCDPASFMSVYVASIQPK